MNKTTKYLIPTLKANQFTPIPITGIWEFIENKKCWICHNATPYYYSEIKISESALIDHKS